MQNMLVLNINPEVEGDMVDYLLEQPKVSGFTSFPARGHGTFQKMNLTEQVTGRRKRIQIEIVLDEKDVQPLIDGLKENVGTDIFYRIQAIQESGRIE